MDPLHVPRRTLLLASMFGILLIAFLGWILGKPTAVTAANPITASAPGRARPTAGVPQILTIPPARMRELVDGDTLLRPDRRFVIAFEEVARLTRGRPVTAAVSTRARKWTVDVGLGLPSSLSAIPEFVETLDALRAAASAAPPVPAGPPLSAADATRLRALASDPFTDGPVRALREIDGLWATGTDRTALFDLASGAWVTLLVQLPDSFEMGDLIAGRALGLLALAEATSKTRFPERAALLASLLGYGGEAQALAASLPPLSPAGLFIYENDTTLENLAKKEASSPSTRYLYLLQHARVEGGASAVDDWLRMRGPADRSGIATFALLLRTGDAAFDSAFELNSALVRAALAGVGAATPRLTPGLVASFERSLAALPAPKGPLFDDAAAKAQHRAAFYSGLHGLASFTLDSLSSGPASVDLAALLAGSPAGPGAQFQRWFSHLADVKSGRTPVAGLRDDPGSLPDLGQVAVRRTARQLQESLYATAPEKPVVAAALSRVLDSRPANGRLWVTVCLQSLHDPLTAQEYQRASNERLGAGGDHDPWLLDVTGDVAGLRAVATDPRGDPWQSVLAVGYLVDKDAISGDELRGTLVALLRRPLATFPAMRAVRLLWEHGYLLEGEAFLQKWLFSHRDAHPLTQAVYASRLEHVLFLQHRYGEAWGAIEPYVSTGKADALGAATEALEGVGRHAEALEMAHSHIERYPDDGWARAGLAQLLWRQGRYEEAARPLIDSRFPISTEDWRKPIPWRFFEVFREAKPAAPLAAVEALARAGVNPWFLFELASPFARDGRYDVAIALLDAVAASKGESLDGYLRAYQYREKQLGREAAVAWFRETVAPSRSAAWVGETAFDERAFELLWLLPDADRTWLLRAAAAAFEGGAPAARRAMLEAHFRDPKTPAADATDGLYLLGLVTEEKLLEGVADGPRRSDVAFLLGVRAAGEKRLVDASDWFRVCVRTEQRARPSFGRAREFLKRWDTKHFGVPGADGGQHG